MPKPIDKPSARVFKVMFRGGRRANRDLPDVDRYVVAPNIIAALSAAQGDAVISAGPGKRPNDPKSIAIIDGAVFSDGPGANSINHALYLVADSIGYAVFVSAIDLDDAADEYRRWMDANKQVRVGVLHSIQRVADTFLRAS